MSTKNKYNLHLQQYYDKNGFFDADIIYRYNHCVLLVENVLQNEENSKKQNLEPVVKTNRFL